MRHRALELRRIALLAALAIGTPALAANTDQTTGATSTAVPQMGEVVRDQNGALSPNFRAQHFCDQKGICHDVVIDLRTHAPVGVDGKWADALKETGNGGEVVRGKPFSEAERPERFDPSKIKKSGDIPMPPHPGPGTVPN